MESSDPRRASDSAQSPLRETLALPYEPPAVSWEEEFSPVAASCDPLDPDCTGGGGPKLP